MKTIAKLSLAAGALAGVALVAALAMHGGDAARDTAPVSAPSSAVVTEAPMSALDDGDRAVVAQAVAALPSAVERRLRGQLIVENDGPRIEADDARMSLRVATASGAERALQIEVKAGRFELVARADETRILIERIRVDGWNAEALTPDVSIAGNGELRIVARLRSGLLLHVIDAASRNEIADVTLVRAQNSSFRDRVWMLTCPSREIQSLPWIDGVASPIELPSLDSAALMWVSAAGHAWRRVDVEGDSGERTVALTPACALLVRLPVDERARCKGRLDLVGAGDRALMLRETLTPYVDQELLLERLPAGAYDASLSCSSGRDATRIAAKRLVLEPGATTTWDVQLTTDADLGGIRVTVRDKDGVREPEYELTRFDSRGSPIDSERAERPKRLAFDGGDGAYHALAAQLDPGAYAVAVHPWELIRRVDVFADQESAVEFDPAEQIPVVVRVVDASTGEALRGSSVLYANALGAERAPIQFEATEGLESGGWRVRVEPGLVDIACRAPGYASSRSAYFVSVPEQRLVISLYASAGLPIALTLKQGEALVPLSLDAWVGVSIESGPVGAAKTSQEFHSTGFNPAASRSVLRVSAPGAYVLRVPAAVCGGTQDRLVAVDVKPDGASVEIQREE